jgi:hypothetical protein
VDDELALARFEVVVVVELLAADELLERRRRPQLVDAELALDQLGVGVGPFPRHAVDPQGLDRAPHVDRPLVHRVPDVWPDVPADDDAASLHHETGVRSGVAPNQDRSALLIDPGSRAHASADHDVPAAKRGAGQRAGVLPDAHHARHHVLAARPADPPLDLDLGTVDDAQAEVPKAPLEADAAPGQDAHAQRMLGARVLHRHVIDALLVQEPAKLQVDLAGRQPLRVERGSLAHDVRDLEDLRVWVGEAPCVVGDPALAGAHRVHTSTSLS